MTEKQEAAIEAITDRFRVIAAEYQNLEGQIRAAQETIAKLQSQLEPLRQQAGDCYAAARVLNFDLIARVAAPPPTYPLSSEMTFHIEAPTPPVTVMPATRSIRDEILALAKTAFPEPLRAASVKEQLEKTRGPLHYKTVGMTLYRLAKEGKMVRRGQKNWFYVPPHDDAETENPGVAAPGLTNSDQ